MVYFRGRYVYTELITALDYTSCAGQRQEWALLIISSSSIIFLQDMTIFFVDLELPLRCHGELEQVGVVAALAQHHEDIGQLDVRH